MATTSTCMTSVDLCAIRVAELTSTGAPNTGADHGYVSEAAIKLDIGIEVDKGDEKIRKNGCGAVMAAFKDPDTIKRLNLSMDLSQLDALLLEILTNSQTFVSGTEAVGFQFAAVGSTPSPVCLEGWSKAWLDDSQIVDAFTSPSSTWIHWVFPFTQWIQGNLIMDHDIQIVPVTANGAENAHITANGPFDDWPSPVANAGGVTRIGGWFYDSTHPSQTCLRIPVTSGAS